MREDRQDAIAAAAYRLLEQHGFAATTMQAIAREARASMETFYRWYGDKTGLFRALIARNTAEVATRLDALDSPGLDRLQGTGAALLTMLLGDRAVALNRAAAADATGTLGAALAEGGRNALLPRLHATVAQAQAAGALAPDADTATLTEHWLALLLGDLQIRRVTGAMPALPPAAIAQRAETAATLLARLYAPGVRPYL
jgi:AcrR family transcriptional regulator